MSGFSEDRSSLFLASGVSPPQPSPGSCRQKKKTCKDRKMGFMVSPHRSDCQYVLIVSEKVEGFRNDSSDTFYHLCRFTIRKRGAMMSEWQLRLYSFGVNNRLKHARPMRNQIVEKGSLNLSCNIRNKSYSFANFFSSVLVGNFLTFDSIQFCLRNLGWMVRISL